jgi:hypothetical protein
MAHLSSLSFTTAPQKSYDPKQVRRQKLIERLEEQKRLVADPTFIPVVKRWKKNPDGSKSIFDHYRRLKPWWTVDATGTVILTIRAGLRLLEFEKGKTGILVGSVNDLGEVLDILIAACRAGELDLLLASATDIEERAVPKTKKRSKSRSNF